ncbi:uncharacterized protein [Nicotiana tomentosiformis]|uniref:uncharacterized protein n=1 Tax=Nicotiana tomentosiformis TaxID=4098 RepID=UPI00051C4A37|nr:uncharacterized protein LOC117276552 [Nicotiana tomentosiformis]
MSQQPHLANPNIEGKEHVMKNSPTSFSDYDPPNSFWLSKDSERYWFDQNAAMQRKSSMKFAFSCKSKKNSKALLSYHSFSSLNQKPKTSFFALPKTRKSFSADGNLRVNKVSKSKFRFTRSRSEPIRKMMMRVTEPGSPKVTCTGRIRRSKSKKDKAIRTGFWKKVRAALNIRSGAKGVDSVRTSEPAGSPVLKRLATRRRSES